MNLNNPTPQQLKFMPLPEDIWASDQPFLFKAENVSRYEKGCVYMLDRRVYPHEKRFERCETYADTALAIKIMVTQSCGPAYAVACGMTQAAYIAKNLPRQRAEEELVNAKNILSATRPTNNNVRYVSESCLETALAALEAGENPEDALVERTRQIYRERDTVNYFIGCFAASLIEDGQGVLTHCFAESGIAYTFMALKAQGKTNCRAYCCETRPYLQGARLTADCISELGFDTTVITDGMPSYYMSKGLVNIFFSGADRLTEKGDVINKIGTFPSALSARYYKVPFYPFALGADPGSKTAEDVKIELRNPDEVLHCLGVRTATRNETVHGGYPAFDVTPAELVTGVITDKGIYTPENLSAYTRDGFII